MAIFYLNPRNFNPRFQVNVGAEWYLHTIYTVRSSTRKVRRHTMVRRAANTAQDLIGPNYNRGTNMHLIPLTEEAEIDELEQLQAGTSWIIAAILGAVLIGEFGLKILNGPKCGKMDGLK